MATELYVGERCSNPFRIHSFSAPASRLGLNRIRGMNPGARMTDAAQLYEQRIAKARGRIASSADPKDVVRQESQPGIHPSTQQASCCEASCYFLDWHQITLARGKHEAIAILPTVLFECDRAHYASSARKVVVAPKRCRFQSLNHQNTCRRSAIVPIYVNSTALLESGAGPKRTNGRKEI